MNCHLTVADVFANDDPQTYTKCVGELNETISGIITLARSRKTAQENVAAAALEKENELTAAQSLETTPPFRHPSSGGEYRTGDAHFSLPFQWRGARKGGVVSSVRQRGSSIGI
jgi:hypothetical protein